MSTAPTIVTAHPADPLRPQGPWLVMVNNRHVSTHHDQTAALRQADNLRELLISKEEVDDTDGASWSPRHTRSVLGVLLVMLVLASIGFCAKAHAANSTTTSPHLDTQAEL